MPTPTDAHLEAVLQPWLDESLPLVTPTNPISNHIDALIGQVLPASQMVAISVRAFDILIALLKRRKMPVKPVLFIPLLSLGPSITVATPRNLQEITAQLTDEPPGPYLLHWESSRRSWREEKYSAPLSFTVVEGLPSDVLVTYQEARHGSDIVDNEPFARDIRADYYPLGVQQW